MVYSRLYLWRFYFKILCKWYAQKRNTKGRSFYRHQLETDDRKAGKPQLSILVQWRPGWTGVKYYDIERSIDGIQFNQIALIPARNTSNPSEYAQEDLSPFAGASYYRLKIVQQDGKIDYSKMEKVNIDTDGSFTANLQVGRQGTSIVINNKNSDFKNVTLNIYTATGQRIYSAPQHLTGGVNRISVPAKTSQPLFIQIVTGTNEAKTFKIF